MQSKLWLSLALGFTLIVGSVRAEEAKKDEAKKEAPKPEVKAEAKPEVKEAKKSDEQKAAEKLAEKKAKEEKKAAKEASKLAAESAPVSYPEAVSRAWGERYKDAQSVQVKDRGDSFEFTGSDPWNEKIKAVYGRDGKLWSESERNIPLAKVPAAVIETAKKWAPTATWSETASVETDKGEQPVYEVEGTLNGKKIEAEIREDGSVEEADKLSDKNEDIKEAKADVKSVKPEAEKKPEAK